MSLFISFSFEDKVGTSQNRPVQPDGSRFFHHAQDLHHPALEQASHPPHLLESKPARS